MRAGSSALVEANDKRIYETRIIYADSTFFDFFDMPFVEGPLSSPMGGSDKIILTKNSAQRYFGKQRALGKVVRLDSRSTFTVSGVVDLPTNSHLKFDFIIPSEYAPRYLNRWIRWSCWTYFHLERKSDPGDVASMIGGVIERHANPSDPIWDSYQYELQPLKDIHNSSDMAWDVVPKVSFTKLSMLLTIAVGVLILGCINFINLATAKATDRSKEIAVKKVLGAPRHTVISQYMIECVILSSVGGLLAAGMIVGLIPYFNELAGADIAMNFLDYKVYGFLAVLSILTGLCAGIYPAMMISACRAGEVLKNNNSAKAGNPWLRKGLIVLQFAVSAGLIIGALIINSQLVFMQQMDLGYDREGVVAVTLREPTHTNFKRVQQELMSHDAVTNVSAASHNLGAGSGTWTFYPPGMVLEDQNSLADYIRVEESFFKLMDLKVVQGRTLSSAYPTDVTRGLILNEAAVKKWDIKDPVGTSLRTDIDGGALTNYRIVGVVKDFHYKNPESVVEPLVLDLDTALAYRNVYVRSSHIGTAIQLIEKIWGDHFPEFPVQYKLQEAVHTDSIKQFATFRTVISVFSGVAILVSCIGLLGLINYTLAQKRKEMAIRKVLGSTVTGIFLMISGSLVVLIVIANVLAWPLTYLIMKQWLTQFAFRIDIGIWTFVATMGLSIFIVFLLVSYQTVSAAQTNPAEVLKEE